MSYSATKQHVATWFGPGRKSVEEVTSVRFDYEDVCVVEEPPAEKIRDS